jgi:hypothetical protein
VSDAGPRLRAAEGRLSLDGRPWFMRAAEFHYFRIARALWEPGLARLAALGFNCITTYVPWIWHEPEPGRYDFTGATDPRRDVLGFVAACRAAGLPLIVRPGPFIYAEYEGLGHPRWLEQTAAAALMRGPTGKPVGGAFWAAYSLGHPAYRAAVAGWYGAVAQAFAGTWDDPIIAWQLDNETGMLYANGTGRWDWNPDTTTRYHAWLAADYGTIGALNAAWGSRYVDWVGVNPPRLPRFRRGEAQDWTRFLEAWIADYLGWLRDTARAAGVPVPFTHNDSANFIPPINPAAKIAAGVADLPGYDLYVKMTGQPTATDYPWGSAWSSAYFRAITPPGLPLLCWELGAGWFDPRSTASDASLRDTLLGSLAHGLQGFSLYIAHDAVEASGHPYTYRTVLDAQGQPGPRYAETARLLAFLRAYEADLLAAEPPGSQSSIASRLSSVNEGSGDAENTQHATRNTANSEFKIQNSELPRPAPVLGFAFHFPDFRFTHEDYLPGIGLPDPARVLALVMGAFGLYAALLAAGYGPALRMIDLATATPADLAACTAVVLPTKGLLAAETYAMLQGYVEGGGHLITCGRTPRRTLTGAALNTRRLYPAPVRRTAILGGLPILASIGGTFMVKYNLWDRARLGRLHPTSLHILDLSEPLTALFYAPQTATVLRDRTGQAVRGDYLRQTYSLAADRARWTAGGQAAGYRVRVGRGSSTMIGSLPGGSYFTPQYYRLMPDEREAIRAFWTDLLTPFGLAPPIDLSPGLEIEVAHRPFPGGTGGLLFLINRLPTRQTGHLHIPGITGPLHPIFGSPASRATPGPDGLAVDLAGHDCIVLRWEQDR